MNLNYLNILNAAIITDLTVIFLLIEGYINTQKNIQYLDVHTAMLDDNKEVFKDIFIADKLHMNPKGYLIWQKQFAPFLTTPK